MRIAPLLALAAVIAGAAIGRLLVAGALRRRLDPGRTAAPAVLQGPATPG